ncbi:inner membrane protein [Halogranum amylolyticum]|uniref:Inner membrane protein n=1 Tax=Halogranum amylolyticum TaxID=660520 RepID=A0A1H8T4V8_9EURY|nr:metal-dependent hydrolase [Halogranum amylolyticum]SEO85835.1 inner membrane protein [Halogranum amylolyticum]
MYFPGHVGIALLCFTPVAILLHRYGLRRAVRVGTVGFLLTASAPDVDLYLAAVPHRGVTHTATAAVAVGVLFGVVGALTRAPGFRRRRYDFFFTSLVGAVGIGTHLLGDVVTPMGIRPFAPLFDAHYTLSLVRASDPTVNAGLLAAGLTTYRLHGDVARLLDRAPLATNRESVATVGETDNDPV